MPQLELRNIVKIYPFINPKKYFFNRKKAEKVLEEQRRMPYLSNEGVIAVQQYSLTVEEGEFVVLYGPSGCGKSTVLRMIAGLTDVTDGELLIDGEDMEGVLPEERDVAMVFQEYSLYPHFTVAQNIAFPLRNLHLPREELDRKVELMLRLLELTGVKDEKPATLSGGEMQRTAIGRALIRRPKIFLMDEPFSNLDTPLRRKLRVLMKKIHQEIGTTFIYVTHDMYEAMSLATKLVLMKDGMIVQEGSPGDIYSHPENITSGTMIGAPAMNIFRDAVLLRDEDGCVLRVLGKEFPCRKKIEKKCGPVILGLRPVHFEMFREPGADSGEMILCTVLRREDAGTEVHFVLEPVEGESCEIRTAIRSEDPAAGVHEGQEVWIRPRTEEAFLFDTETEMRLQ